MGRPQANPDPVDLLLTLLILHKESMGRYTLSTYLNLTKAKTRSILDYMIHHELAESHKGRGGTALTIKGRSLCNSIHKFIELVWDEENVSIDPDSAFIPKTNSYAICFLNSPDPDTNGLYERDLAVRAGGNGAITLIREGDRWIYNDPNPEFRIQPSALLNVRPSNSKFNLLVICFGSSLGTAYAGLGRIILYHCGELLDYFTM